MLSLFGRAAAAATPSAEALVATLGPLTITEVNANGDAGTTETAVSSLWRDSGALIFVVRRPG